jgi:thiol-disulfide isomerase/thioredoxin
MMIGMVTMAVGVVVGWASAEVDGADAAGAKAKAKEAVARVSLEMHPEVLTSEMHRKSFLMSFPRRVELMAEKPATIVKEPQYAGAPRYATIDAGTGPKSDFIVAFDESAGAPKLYVDANHDGDLTNDPPVAWESVKADKGKTFLETLLRLPVSWSRPGGRAATGVYGVTLRKTQGLDVAFLTRAGARTGSLELDGKTYPVALAENTADAVYDNAHAAETKKPAVWLMVDLNGDKDFHPTSTGREVFDTARPFQLAGSWYTAEFPTDGSSVILKRAEAPPPVPEKPRNALLGAGRTMPDFALVYAGGRPGKFSQTRGKIRVIDMWATWCGPCIAAMPRVEALYQQVKGQGVEVIGLDVMDDEASYKSFVAEKKGTYHYTFARDDDGKQHEASGIAERIGVYAIPTLFLIDKDDKVVTVLQGFGDENEAKLKSALRGLGIKVD